MTLGATFTPEWVHSGSPWWLCICLHDTNTKCHAGVSHPGASSLWLLSRGEKFTPVRLQYHVNAKRPHISVWNRSAGSLEQVAHALCLRFWITHVFYQHDVYLQIARYEMSQSSCKRDKKSKSHPGMKFTPVRVFSCKHPLRIGVHLQNREV